MVTGSFSASLNNSYSITIGNGGSGADTSTKQLVVQIHHLHLAQIM